jgi:hypothetical protein
MCDCIATGLMGLDLVSCVRKRVSEIAKLSQAQHLSRHQINLQVLAEAGDQKERKQASKVLKLLQKGRHWVLVVLLLSNVVRLKYSTFMVTLLIFSLSRS